MAASDDGLKTRCHSFSWTSSEETREDALSRPTQPPTRVSESAPQVDTVTPSTATSTSTATSSRQFLEPAQTMIFLDWDDTLFPFTGLFDHYGLPRTSEAADRQLPPELEQELRAWQQAAQELLCVMIALSDQCVIVTNSRPPWVEASIHRFAPQLEAMLEKNGGRLRIVYANEVLRKSRARQRSSETAGWCCLPPCWRGGSGAASLERRVEEQAAELTEAKKLAMQIEAEAFYSRYPGQTWKNLISLGDMAYERDALQALGAARRGSPAREQLRTKAVLFPGGPSVSELTLRLRFSQMLLPAFVRFDGDLDLDLCANPLEAVAEAFDMAQLRNFSFSAWSSSGAEEDEKESPGGPTDEEVLDEVAVVVHDWLLHAAE